MWTKTRNGTNQNFEMSETWDRQYSSRRFVRWIAQKSWKEKKIEEKSSGKKDCMRNFSQFLFIFFLLWFCFFFSIIVIYYSFMRMASTYTHFLLSFLVIHVCAVCLIAYFYCFRCFQCAKGTTMVDETSLDIRFVCTQQMARWYKRKSEKNKMKDKR